MLSMGTQLTKFLRLNDLYLNFMKEKCYLSLNLTYRKDKRYVYSRNLIKFGNKSLKSLGANIWNSVPENIK